MHIYHILYRYCIDKPRVAKRDSGNNYLSTCLLWKIIISNGICKLNLIQCIFRDLNSGNSTYAPLRFAFEKGINDNAKLLQAMAWKRTSVRPIPEQVMHHFPDTYIHHYAPVATLSCYVIVCNVTAFGCSAGQGTLNKIHSLVLL